MSHTVMLLLGMGLPYQLAGRQELTKSGYAAPTRELGTLVGKHLGNLGVELGEDGI